MLIKCTKCGYENELGAIFCRGCGEKIDTSALDPRANGGKKGGKKDDKSGWFGGLFGAVGDIIKNATREDPEQETENEDE